MTSEAARRMAAAGRKPPPLPSDTETQKGRNTETQKHRKSRENNLRPVFATAPKSFAKRLTLDLTESDHRKLKMAAVKNSAAMADLLRGLMYLAMDDPELWIEAKERI